MFESVQYLAHPEIFDTNLGDIDASDVGHQLKHTPVPLGEAVVREAPFQNVEISIGLYAIW
jgi:hypothetical protein